MDGTITYKEHLTKNVAKLKTRYNIVKKLQNSKWGLDTNALRISTVSLTLSVADYCSPVWLQNANTNKVDTLLAGAVKFTPKAWLPVFCSKLSPPRLHLYNSLIREWIM